MISASQLKICSYTIFKNLDLWFILLCSQQHAEFMTYSFDISSTYQFSPIKQSPTLIRLYNEPQATNKWIHDVFMRPLWSIWRQHGTGLKENRFSQTWGKMHKSWSFKQNNPWGLCSSHSISKLWLKEDPQSCEGDLWLSGSASLKLTQKATEPSGLLCWDQPFMKLFSRSRWSLL